MTDTIHLFDEPKSFPDVLARRRYGSLVGLDDMKETAVREALALLAPQSVAAWSKRHHAKVLRATELLADRTPLLVFSGDVGTGKTALAESFGDEVARRADTDVLLFPLSLSPDPPIGWRGGPRMDAAMWWWWRGVGQRARSSVGALVDGSRGCVRSVRGRRGSRLAGRRVCSLSVRP